MDDDAIIAFEKGEINNSEVNPENLARAEEWENSMSGDDVPEFAGEWAYPTAEANATNTETSEPSVEEEPIKRNEIVADASAALLYGVNGIAQKAGIEATMDAVEKLDVDSSEYPMWDLMVSAGIDTKNEIGDVRNANKMTTEDINDYCNNNVNAPVVTEKSKEGERKALKDLQEMIQWAKNSSECAKLRDEAKSRDENLFKYATNEKPERGMVQMLEVLGRQRKEEPKAEKVEEEKAAAPEEAGEEVAEDVPEEVVEETTEEVPAEVAEEVVEEVPAETAEEVVEEIAEEPEKEVTVQKGYDENGNLVEVVVKKEQEPDWKDITE